MSEDLEPFEVSVAMTRGTSTDDRDKIKATISAESLEELDEKMIEMRDRLSGWRPTSGRSSRTRTRPVSMRARKRWRSSDDRDGR